MPGPAYAYRLIEPGRPLERVELPAPTPGAGEVTIQVAGCGLCHTDVAFASGEVRTRRALPLSLGHEVAGIVTDAGSEEVQRLVGCPVVVPAVLPCAACAACRAGRPTICSRQRMPGCDIDGGFATWMVVPARHLCLVPAPADGGVGPEGLSLWELAVIADALTTPLEAIARADVVEGDLVVVIGAGGVGGFAVQIAVARGARVVAVDVDPRRLEQAVGHGAAMALDARNVQGRVLKERIAEFARIEDIPGFRHKIFECSGTAAGQESAFSLLSFGAQLGVVGYTRDPVSLRLSNLMAFDAVARGNWGSDPTRLSEALALVVAGSVKLRSCLRGYDLSDVNQVLAAAAAGKLDHRPVLRP
jgi:6-hydroxycyclohex-1-ene-1-carbonyl-CoA dehydrogenase